MNRKLLTLLSALQEFDRNTVFTHCTSCFKYTPTKLPIKTDSTNTPLRVVKAENHKIFPSLNKKT